MTFSWLLALCLVIVPDVTYGTVFKAFFDILPFLASLKHYLFPIDDAFVGVLLKEIGKTPSEYRKFRSWGNDFRGNMTDPCYWHEQVLTFHRRLPNELRKTWELYNMVMGRCQENKKRRRKRFLDNLDHFLPVLIDFAENFESILQEVLDTFGF